MILHGTLSAVQTISGTLTTQPTIIGSLSIPLATDTNPYQGQYEVTPSEETIVLETRNKSMNHNVTVNAIPSNYGRISWDGRSLTVW